MASCAFVPWNNTTKPLTSTAALSTSTAIARCGPEGKWEHSNGEGTDSDSDCGVRLFNSADLTPMTAGREAPPHGTPLPAICLIVPTFGVDKRGRMLKKGKRSPLFYHRKQLRRSEVHLLGMTYQDLADAFARRYGKGAVLAAAVYREFFQRLNPHAWLADGIAASPGLAGRLRRDLRFSPGVIVDEEHQDGVVKLVLELDDGHRIETVILPLKTHFTLCVSSQVGCRMGCRFCQTARLGLVRQLTAAEIVGQVYTARRRFGRRIRNVVFMGMGEPLDNYEAVIQAVRVLSDQRGLDIALRYITISTAGRLDGIRRLAEEGLPHLKLAVSLNAPGDPLRDALMPLNRRAPLAELQRTLMAFPLKKGYDIMVAYVLIPGVNDSRECMLQLAHWLAPLRAKVNLIPLNPGPDIPFRPPLAEELETFRKGLIALNVNVQNRLSRGRELMAACGQLGGRPTFQKPAPIPSAT